MLLLIAIFSIIILYFIIALSPLKLCAVCSAVSLTWLGLLASYFLNLHQDILLIGILMGGSVVGLMYQLEKYFKNKQLTNFWLIRILLMGFGFVGVYLLLLKKWEELIWFIVLIILVSFSSLFFVKSRNINRLNKSESKLKEKLEHCCD
jgi:hypothetical protein